MMLNATYTFLCRYYVDMVPTTGIATPFVPEETRNIFAGHLESHNDWALLGKYFYH